MNEVTPLRVERHEWKNDINGLLLTSGAFSVLLLLARIAYTGRFTFGFLVWNLFLATVPYFLSTWMEKIPEWTASRKRFIPVFIAWLLIIPNSFYILTDLFHLHIGGAAPLWYDLLLIVSFAWNALVMGILSVRHMEKKVAFFWPRLPGWLFLLPVMALNAFGVYIGRYLRFNSWDVISNPFRLVMDIADIALHPLQYKGAWGMVVCFSFFLSILYTTIKKISKSGL